MFKLFRLRTHKFFNVRAKDLKVNDRFVYDKVAVMVKEIIPYPEYESTQVTFAPIKTDGPWCGQWRTVSIYDIQLIPVARPR